MAKRFVELKDKTTSFHDFETDFDITRNQRRELGQIIGKATRQALRSGRLVEVNLTSTREEGNTSHSSGK